MMRPDELRLKMNVLDTFVAMVETYDKLKSVTSVNLYYVGHTTTNHGDDTEALRIVRRALVEHWKQKLELEASNLRSHGIDPSSLLPKDML
jgi:hypothetical protein